MYLEGEKGISYKASRVKHRNRTWEVFLRDGLEVVKTQLCDNRSGTVETNRRLRGDIFHHWAREFTLSIVQAFPNRTDQLFQGNFVCSHVINQNFGEGGEVVSLCTKKKEKKLRESTLSLNIVALESLWGNLVNLDVTEPEERFRSICGVASTWVVEIAVGTEAFVT